MAGAADFLVTAVSAASPTKRRAVMLEGRILRSNRGRALVVAHPSTSPPGCAATAQPWGGE